MSLKMTPFCAKAVLALLLCEIGKVNSFPVERVLGKESDGDKDGFTTSYFFNIEERETNLFYCDGYSDGIKYRLPEDLDCNEPPILNAKRKSKVVTATVFWTDISVMEIKGWECWGDKYSTESYKWFGGAVSTTKNAPQKVYVSESQCKEMKNQGTAPDGRNLQRISDGTQGTIQHEIPEASWLRTTVAQNLNYYIRSVTMTVNKDDNTINTIAQVTKTCLATEGNCPTNTGLIIWSPSDVPACRVKEGLTSPCLLTGNRLTCQEMQFSFNNLTLTELCGKKVAVHSDNTFFTSTVESEIMQGVVSTDDARKAFKAPLVRSKRQKRDFPHRDPVTFVSGNEFNPRSQFLYDIMSEGHNFDVLNLHFHTCQNAQRILDLAKYMAETGDPTALARTLTGDPSYRARMAGDVISIFKCHKITKYYFLPRDPANCTLEAPIKFMYGNQLTEGWLTGISHEIVKSPTYVKCPSPNFYFQTEKSLILVTNRSRSTDFPHLPYSISGPNLLPPLSFDAPGVYSKEDIAYDNRAMMKELSQRGVSESAIRNYINGNELSDKEMSVKETVQDWSWDGISVWIMWIVISLITIGFMVTFVALRIYFDPLKKIVDGSCHCVTSCFRYLTRQPPKPLATELNDIQIDRRTHSPFHTNIQMERPSMPLITAQEGVPCAPSLPSRNITMNKELNRDAESMARISMNSRSANRDSWNIPPPHRIYPSAPSMVQMQNAGQ